MHTFVGLMNSATKVSINSSPNNAFNRGRSPDTVDMSGVVKSIQMGPISRGPDDEKESEVPEGRKSFVAWPVWNCVAKVLELFSFRIVLSLNSCTSQRPHFRATSLVQSYSL